MKIICNQCLHKLLGFYCLHKYDILAVLVNLLSNTIDKKSDINQFFTISILNSWFILLMCKLHIWNIKSKG